MSPFHMTMMLEVTLDEVTTLTALLMANLGPVMCNDDAWVVNRGNSGDDGRGGGTIRIMP